MVKQMQNFIFTGPYGEIECIVSSCDKAESPVLIMAHGFRGSRDGGGRAIELAEQLSDQATVIRFNFNGSQILSHQIEELQAVVEKVNVLLPYKKIFLLGRSMGGAASIIVAARLNLIHGLVLWSAPNNLRKTFRQVLGDELYYRLDSGEVLHMQDERGCLDLTPDFLTDIDNYDLSAALSDINIPVMILHGKIDETVTVEQAYDNYALLKGRKILHVFENGDHSLGTCNNEAGRMICQWLAECS